MNSNRRRRNKRKTRALSQGEQQLTKPGSHAFAPLINENGLTLSADMAIGVLQDLHHLGGQIRLHGSQST
jgi:hypothetical protein